MTREEQKQYNAENYPASVLNWLNESTDRAYDEFNSRTCDNCNYEYHYTSDMKHEKRCRLKIYGMSSTNSKDFGCNEFINRKWVYKTPSM